MNQLISTFQSQQGQFWQALLEHIQISLISIFIAILISIPLALLLRRLPKIAEPVLQVTGIFQTIPSLALLGLLIPFIGNRKFTSNCRSCCLCDFPYCSKYLYWFRAN